MNKEIFLYVKTHTKTGLKYFGRTSNKDPFKYKGSGTYWKQHLKEFGDDISTEILGCFTDIKSCSEFAKDFSQKYDIVNSSEWANVMCENGFLGGFDYINSNGLNLYDSWGDDAKIRYETGSFLGGCISYNNKLGIHNLTKEQRVINGKLGNIACQKAINEKYGVKSIFSLLNGTEELKEKHKLKFKEINHQQGSTNSQYGTCWIFNLQLKINKKIKLCDLSLYLNEGWIKGRKMNF